MRTELNGGSSPAERERMENEYGERANGFLPAGVVQIPKEELQRYLKCKRIGNYLLGKTIGEGSFARVKQGFHVLTGEKVAIKIIDKKQAHQDKYVARNMRREAKIMQMIRHPNIVQLLEVVETEHRYYLITELAAGGDLMDYICYRRKLGEVEVRKFIRQTVSAVHYLHQGGILHRDLKVENLLLDDDYNIKIIDFGLSNTLLAPSPEGHPPREFLKTQCGSPAYAAPEILGHKPYGPEVDVWSIGVNMYAMLTGKLPYTAEPFHITTLHNKMKNGDMNPIPEHLSAPCKDLIRRFLTFNREQRITLEEALGHEWLRKGYDGPVIPVMFPNYPRHEEMDKNILRHMTNKMEFEQQEIIDAVTQNRATSSATVYHLLRRKLKKYYIKHPGKAKDNTESVKGLKETDQERENITQLIKRPECTVATAVVCDFNDKEERTLKEDQKVKDSHSDKKLKVSTCRGRLSSQSQENLSTSNEELAENKSRHTNDKDTEKLKDETDAVEKDETCSVLSNAGIEISRRNSLNYSSVEVMAVKGRQLSLNLSHISLETKVTVDQQSLKNTSGENLDEHGDGERPEAGENALKDSPRRVDTMPSLTQEKTLKSPKHPGPSAPSIGKVSLISAKIISIPLQQSKQDSSDKVKFPQRRFSLPQSYLPSKNLGTNQQRQPVTSPFNFSSTLSSSDAKQRSKESSVLPPYGLCCQLTAIKPQDESGDPGTRAKDDKSHGDPAAQCNGIDSRHVQMRRNVHCPSTSTDKEQQRWKRHSIGTPGGKELLKSINNTLGRLMELQDKSDPFKAHGQDNLLLRSRLPPATLNGPLKREGPLKDLKLSLIQENAGVERVKARRNGPKISCSVTDNQSHQKQQDLSNLNTESNSTKEKVIRESRQNKLGQHDRAARRRRRRTIENKVSFTADKDDRRHLRDDTRKTTHETGRRSRDSPEELI